ncbi:MAG: hypothetical protein ACC648_04490 [Thiohalobacterales bacterium]
MTITEFHSMAVAALAAEPDEAILIELAKQAQQLSDMVGWADGIIDKEGRVSGEFIRLQAQARTQYEATGDKNLAILHDALGDLLAAIFRHDEDLTPSSNTGDDGVDV